MMCAAQCAHRNLAGKFLVQSVDRMTAGEIKAKWRRQQILMLDHFNREVASSWRCRQIHEVKQASSNDTPDTCELDPSILACFGNMNEEAMSHLDSTLSGTSTCRRIDNDQSFMSEPQSPLPLMSGFLSKRGHSIVPHRLFQRWQDRWFVLIPHRCGAEIECYKEESYGAPPKKLIVGSTKHGQREPSLDSSNRFGFSFTEHGSGRRLEFAAPTDAKAQAWISCVNSLLDDSRRFNRCSSAQ
jgi:hypothetical protein